MQGISVLIVTHNRAHLIEETIKSVLSQTYKHFEILVIDDGSTDNTEEIVSSINDSRIVYHKYARIGRLTTLRNIAVNKSRFQFVAFVDSDDLWIPEKLEKCLLVCNSSPCDICIADCIEFNSSGNTGNSRGYLLNSQPQVNIGKEILENNIPLTYGSNLFFRKEIYTSGLKFDEDLFVGDHDFMMRSAYKFRAVYIPEVLTRVRKHEKNMTLDNKMHLIPILEFNRTLLKLKSEKLISENLYKKSLAKNYYSIASHYQHLKLTKRSIKNLAQSLKYDFNLKTLFHYSKKILGK